MKRIVPDMLALIGCVLMVVGVWIVVSPGAAGILAGGLFLIVGAGASMAENRRGRGHGG
jgi:hypothetical protein